MYLVLHLGHYEEQTTPMVCCANSTAQWGRDVTKERMRSLRECRLAAGSGAALLLSAVVLLAQTQGGERTRSPADAPRVGPATSKAGEDASSTAAPLADLSQDVSASTAGEEAAKGLGRDYVLGPEDVVDIDVFNVPELSRTTRVANDGTIMLPLLGRVQAAGRTVQQLRQELESKWGKTYLENPQVVVFVKEFHAQPVAVLGAVEKPGLYQITGPRTLIEMLSMAGGLAKRGTAPAGRTVLITRKGGFDSLEPVEGLRATGVDQIEIDLRRLLYSQDTGLNIEIRPSDTITVSKADIVYVIGAVNRQGGYVLEDRPAITILQALAMAEGLKSSAAKKNARIIRAPEGGSRTEIPVDVSKILKGQSGDMLLAANDILYIPDSTEKMALKRGAEAIMSTVSGVLIFRSAR